MEIIEMIKEDTITLAVDGRIDTNTSVKLQLMLLNAFQKTEKVEIDLAECDYISSAGLRVLLIGEKTAEAKKGEMKVSHVCDEVLDVLRMSGFHKILHIC